MDKNVLSILQDYKESIDESFQKIDKTLKSVKKADKSQKRAALSSIKQELSNIKSNFGLMKPEVENLYTEENKSEWQEIISKIKPKIKTYEKKIKDFEQENIKSQDPGKEVDHLDVDAKVDLNKLNAQQVIERGNEILNVDDKAIDNMAQIVNKDVDEMKNVNVELDVQQEKLDRVDNDLKEMDYSLKRAGKQITNMFKLYSQDKCITGLIVVILIIIVVIIIVSACGGDNAKNFNVPHDIFTSNNKNSTNTNSAELFSWNNIKIINLIFMSLSLFGIF